MGYILKYISLSSVALYMHRFLENSLAPAFAKRVLGISAWSQIIVGGSNFGEVRMSFLHGFILRLMISQLLGALSVLVLSDIVTTPVPWLRLDALLVGHD